MKDLKDAAYADAGADSGAGGLEGLYDGTENDDLPDFFKIASLGGDVGVTTGGRETSSGGGLGDDSYSNSLFDPSPPFGDERVAKDLFASLGLPLASKPHGSGGRLRVDAPGLGLSGGDEGNVSFGADQSEWARMQKQFEDMNKSFLQE